MTAGSSVLLCALYLSEGCTCIIDYVPTWNCLVNYC